MSYTDDDLDDSIEEVEMTDINEIRNTMADLTTTINLANQAWLFSQQPILSDSMYDEYVAELRRLEEYYPQFKSPNSPNDKVLLTKGDTHQIIRVEQPYKDPLTVQLEASLVSDKLKAFLESCQVAYTAQNVEYNKPNAIIHIGHFYKSVPVVLVYKDGLLKCAISRGDGHSGADLTHSVSSIINVPIALNTFDIEPFLDGVIVRGDIVMPTRAYKHYVSDMVAKGEYLDDSIRVMNRILYHPDNSLIMKYPLAFLAREIISTDPSVVLESLLTHTTTMEYMEMLGFQCIPTRTVECNHQAIMNNIVDIYNNRSNFPFPILGVRVRVNNVTVQEQMQAEATDQYRAWELTVLYPMQRLIMRVTDVKWQVDENDNVVPYFTLQDTTNQSTQYVRLIVLNELLRHSVAIGDIIDCLVRGVNDLIEISYVIKHNDFYPPILPIDYCPTCNHKLYHRESNLLCINQTCDSKIHNSIKRYNVLNNKDACSVPSEMKNVIFSIFKLPHPLCFFKANTSMELIESLTTLLTERSDLTPEPDTTAINFINDFIPDESLMLADLVYALGITDCINTVYLDENNIRTIKDLFDVSVTDAKMGELLKPHEIVGFNELRSNPILLSIASSIDIEHPLVK